MKTATKIRWLLFLVTINLFATALTARWASSRSFTLEKAAEEISEILTEKEKIIYDYINDPKKFNRLKVLDADADLALNTIDYFSSNNIFFQTFEHNKLTFWSDSRVSDKYAVSLKEGTSFISYSNGRYQVVKKRDNDFFVVFYILVKAHYPYQNQFLHPLSGNDVIGDLAVDIAELSDSEVANVKGLNHKYLFSIKKTDKLNDNQSSDIEIILWLAGFLSLGLLINSICKYYADKGHVIAGSLGLILSFVTIRYLCTVNRFPEAFYNLKVFSPTLYASGDLLPSLADLGFNFVGALWCVIFIYSYRAKIYRRIYNRPLCYICFGVFAFIIIAVSFALSEIFKGLVNNSIISFKVANLINLDVWSVVWIGILLTAVLTYYLIIDFLISFTVYIRVRLVHKIIFSGLILLVFGIYKALYGEHNIYFLLIFFLVLVIALVVYQFRGVMVFPALVLIALMLATIVSLKLNNYRSIKEKEYRKLLALKLESADDPQMLVVFKGIEKKILNDSLLKTFFVDKDNASKKISSFLHSKYLNRSLNGYEVKVLSFDNEGKSFDGLIKEKSSDYRSLVESGSLKVSNNFYRVNNTFGGQNYFAILPIRDGENYLGSLVLELKYKQGKDFGNFPQLLKDGKTTTIDDIMNYSYACYINNKLVYQSGDFVYELSYRVDNPLKVKDFDIFLKDGYNHLVYQSSTDKVIIVSKETNTFWKEIASLSFFFIIFLISGIFTLSYKWAWALISSYKFDFKKLGLGLLLNNHKMLYKTRIQIALVLTVVTSLIIVGLITFSYISIQYKEQQESLIKDRIKTITKAFEDKINETGNYRYPEEEAETFKEFSKLYNANLNLYDKNGEIIFSTQPGIYELEILTTRMNPVALINISVRQKSEFLQNENIGDLNFVSAYMPVLNSFNNVVGYLQLPYFSNENDFNQKIGNFLNLLINIYVLVFVAIGFFAFVVANQITSPLTLIQRNMANRAAGNKNESIKWNRNDEIGNLIKEYNRMILALDESANKLAQSERETAWREMAKQVAHEIKNPLTPLRLGIQMLERSWKEKDPNFDAKFNRFSKSFVDQIDSLSHIASEFSNFAKMPDIRPEKVELIEILNQAIHVYKHVEKIQIFCNEEFIKGIYVMADKDQLLRSFNNLFKNAIEAIPEGKDGMIIIHCELHDHSVEIKFEDNGAGIPEELQDKMFTPNFTTKSSGMGLGLAFVKQAIKNMGGNIYFTTTINVGTTFHISLPWVK